MSTENVPKQTRTGARKPAGGVTGGRFALLLGGPVRVTPRLRQQMAGRRVIAADSGILHAEALQVQPELWIGDFDSAPPEALEAHAGVERQAHPPEKDMTDGALALEAALARGARDILFVGALEGRTDHALAHLLQLADLAARGYRAVASSGREEAHGLGPGRHLVDLPAGTRFSLLGFTPLRAVMLRGARWSINDEHIPFASTRPLSNIAEGTVELDIEEGCGVLIASLEEAVA
jgi:thiamine pyrophosphokinase